MFQFNAFKLSNFIIIEFYFILISIKTSFAVQFIDMKQLSLNNSSYFAIFDTGFYLYDFKTLNHSLIHEFNNNEYKASNNVINMTELYYEHKAYIICLVNEYLFIFSEYTYKLIYNKIDDIITFNGDYYNIMPYTIQDNNIRFIISYNNDNTKLLFYYYNFNFDGDITKLKEKIFDDMNIKDKMVRCELNSNKTFIICFYYTLYNSRNNLASTIFYMENMDLIKGNTSHHFNVVNEIKQIKFAKSYNDRFFVCFSNSSVPICIINNDTNDFFKFKEIDCHPSSNYSSKYKVLYFKESDDFMLISIGYCTATILNNYNNLIKKCGINIYEKQSNAYYIIYNNGYNFLNYTNLSYFIKHKNISMLKRDKLSNYLKEINNSFEVSINEEQKLSILNEYMKNRTSMYYIDENEELIIPREEMTITFTSTYNQKKNENSNSTTTINLGECEKKLKIIYNISEESNLYILKIDKNQKGKNYPLIEYEVFYPLNGGEMEILNLSLCEGIDIELSIPIIINDTIDKYNPKSSYYNDICSKTTSKCNTDITLNDRRNEFMINNMSLCEENCELTSYDYIYKKAKCSCKTKATISLDKIELNRKDILKNFIDIKRITNIEIIKCYKIVFNKNNLKNNYGSFFILFIFLLYFLCIIIFFCKSWKSLINEIIKIRKAKNNENYSNKKNQIYIFKKNKNKRGIIKNKTESTFKKIKNKTRIISFKRNINNKNNINAEIYKKDKNIESKNILKYIESELNSLSYEEALKKDKRTYIQYYCSLLKKKQSILFSFYPNKDYNSQIIKSFLFFFFYTSDITVNALFFTEDTMHKIYVDAGKFNFIYQLPITIYSFLISYIINFIIENLSLSEDSIITIKSKKGNNLYKNKKIINRMKIKFCFFFIISFLLLLVFWYYISCFCCIYQNTQIHLFKDSLMSFIISLIYPVFINLIPGIFRISALRNKKGDKSCMYKFSQIIEFS